MNREDFELLNKVIYLDNSAGTLKPKMALNKLCDFYNNFSINMHSIDSRIGQETKEEVDLTRDKVATLLSTKANNIIFTSGTTDGLNRITLSLEDTLNDGDEVLLSPLNHASAHIPWIEIAKRKNIKLIYTKKFTDKISSKTKVIIYAQENNTLHIKLDLKDIYKKAKKVGAIVINDAAQAIVHQKVSMDYCDVVVFSANKLYGPTGLGVLSIKDEYLNKLEPRYVGGGTNTKISEKSWTKKEGYLAWEAGTVNTAGIFMFSSVLDYLNSTGFEKIWKHEKELSRYMHNKIKSVKDIEIYSSPGDASLLFNIGKYSPQDITSHLGHKNIIIRGGRNCVGMLDCVLGIKSLCRVSVALYNTKEDIDSLVNEIKNGGDFLDFV